MPADILTTYSTRATPQNQPATPTQAQNAAGGYVFAVDDWARLRRFLTLGTTGGTYYATARDLTRDNADIVVRLAHADGPRVVTEVVDISTTGRAPKADPGLFALAVVAAHGTDDARRAALDALPQVARTGTHLFTFATYIEQFRGWGRGLRRAVADWYTQPDVDHVAHQAVKYRQRAGWTHRDMLRLAHPATDEPARRALFDWISGRGTSHDTPDLVKAFEATQHDDTSPADLVDLIGDHPITWEMLPERHLTNPDVWAALVDKGMPITALIRQLPRLTRLGLTTGERGKAIANRVSDPGVLRRGRVHPINALVAQRTYASGRSARGESTWTPTRRIVDALDAAFYAAYGAVQPTGKRILLALDVSGSMTAPLSGMPISAREASAALALVTANVEDDCDIVGFTAASGGWYARDTVISDLPISPRQRLDDVLHKITGLPFGPTDCALPMTWALKQGRAYDAFVVITDNETWSGTIHPNQALNRYRQATGIPARCTVIGMTSTGFSIADPDDTGMLDIAGMDAAVPHVLSDFVSGR